MKLATGDVMYPGLPELSYWGDQVATMGCKRTAMMCYDSDAKLRTDGILRPLPDKPSAAAKVEKPVE